MDINRLGLHEQARLGGATHQIVINSDDLTETTANTAQTIEAITVALGTKIECVSIELITDFQDASDAAFNTTTISLGDGSDVDRFLTATEVNTNGTEVDTKVGVDGLYAYTAADTVDVYVTSMSGKSLSNIDAGEAHIYVRVIEPLRIVQT